MVMHRTIVLGIVSDFTILTIFWGLIMREITTQETLNISGGFDNGGYGFTYVVKCAAAGGFFGLLCGSLEAGLVLGSAYGALMFTARTLDAMVFENNKPFHIHPDVIIEPLNA